MRTGKQSIESYIPRLYGYAYSLSCNADDANDLVQETAVKALKATRVPRDEAAYRGWLFTILRNNWLDAVRRRNRRPEIDFVDDLGDTPGGASVWAHEDSLISTLTVKLCLARLSAQHREILGLVDVSGFTYDEAAKILDVPVGTVTSRVARARCAMLADLAGGNVHTLPAERRRQEA